MTSNNRPIYEIALCVRVAWEAHSKSNLGDNGSIRLVPRRQVLADGTDVDACRGSIEKHYHADILTSYMEAEGVAVCPACSDRDTRRAGSLMSNKKTGDITLDQIIASCGVCDTHGFLITGKNASPDRSEDAREKMAKHSLIEYSFSLALPGHNHMTAQPFTRIGSHEDALMLFNKPVRSGEYALCIRYTCAGVGVDTNRWNVIITDQDERQLRHKLILKSVRDQLLSPSGALTSTMLPQLNGLSGAVVLKYGAGRAPMYSPLEDKYLDVLTRLKDEDCEIIPFDSVFLFKEVMDELANQSNPSFPARYLRSLQLKKVDQP